MRPLRDLLSEERLGALLFLLFSFVVIGLGTGYGLGSLSRWGSGTFPVILGICLAILSLVVLIGAPPAKETPPILDEEEPPTPTDAPPLRAVGGIVAGMVAFILTIKDLGLIPAVVALSVLCSFGFRRIRPLHTLLLAAALSALFWFLFILLLQLPIPIVGGFYG